VAAQLAPSQEKLSSVNKYLNGSFFPQRYTQTITECCYWSTRALMIMSAISTVTICYTTTTSANFIHFAHVRTPQTISLNL
jgi:hypothetical protein